MKKKDPVLWVVVDKEGDPWNYELVRSVVERQLAHRNRTHPDLAPFRVVKYLPAPKQRRTK